MTANAHAAANPVAGGGCPRAGALDHARIAVWDLPTRLFHWSFAASFIGAFLTAESERWRDVHVMLGYTFLGLLVFRLIWGFAGSRYARFSSFVTGPAKVVRYVVSLLRGRPEHYVGHNPAGAVAILALIGCGLVISLSGLAVYNEFAGEWAEELHEGAANLMLAVVALHLVGVLVGSMAHRENLVRAMITGDKHGSPGVGIASPNRALGVALLAVLVGAWTAWGWSGAGAPPGFTAGEIAGQRTEMGDHDKDKRRDDDD